MRSAGPRKGWRPNRFASAPQLAYGVLYVPNDMGGLIQDLRIGLRLLVRKPGFTLLALLTLALGIGASTSMFTVLYQVVVRPLPYEAPDELVFINETSLDGTQTYSVSIPNFFDWRERNRTLHSLSAFRAASFNLTSGEAPVRVRGAMVSGDFFTTLGVAPIIGRTFEDDDETSVVLSHGLWQRRFGGRTDILGEELILDGRSFAVRGVMAASFEFLTSTIEIWLPLGVFRHELPWDERGSHPALWTVGRMKAGVTLEQARRDLERVALSIDADFDHQDGVAVTALHHRSVRRSRNALTALMGGVGLLLLIACANVANLLLARSAGRVREMATRSALGAGRSRLIRQLLVESLLLSVVGGLLGLLLGSWGLELLKALLPANTPRMASIQMDGSAILFVLIVSGIVGIAFGLAPLAHVTTSLRSRMGSGPGPARLRGLLVVSEVALAAVLLSGASLLVSSFFRLAETDTGFASENRVAARIDLPAKKYGTAQKSIPFYRELLERVRALPDVRSAAVSTGLPLVDPGVEYGILPEGVQPDRGNFTLASVQVVSRDYFRTMGISLMAGRVFDETDTETSIRVAVVDETLAVRLYPGEPALGKRLRFGGTPEKPVLVTIVGVVRHVLNYQLSARQYVQVYVPFEQPPDWMSEGFPPASFVALTASTPEPLFGAIGEIVAAVDPAQPVFGLTTLDDVLELALTPERTNSILSVSFAAAALALAALGLFGVLTSLVAQRNSEIGIRIALGATPKTVLGAVLREGMRLVVAGLVVGIAGAVLASRALSSLLYGVDLLEPIVLASPALLLVVSFLACSIPARRATKIQAVEALRNE